jgi:hypothetical protein
MSTDIVTWKNNGDRQFQPQALKTYLYVTIPFMFAVFAFWAGLQLHERTKEREKKHKMHEKLAQP